MMDNYCIYIYYGAAQSGILSIFKLMKEQGHPFNSKACRIAAENGHLNIIKWILSEIEAWKESNEGDYKNCINKVMSPAAASKGYLHILKFLPGVTTWNLVAKTALQNGQMTVLEWLQKNNRIVVNRDLVVSAAQSGNLNMLEWLQSEFSIFSDRNWETAIYEATAIGNLDVIKYLQKKGAVFDSRCYDVATKFGHFEVIKQMYESGCKWNLDKEDATLAAAECGHLSVLQWLIEKKCPVNLEQLAIRAIKGGNLELIEWLDKNLSIEWKDSSLCALAVSNSHWDILEWLFTQKCNIEKGILMQAVRKGARLDILQKLFYGAVDIDWDYLCQTAGSYGRFDFIEWISEKSGTSIAWNSSYYGAMRENRVDFMKKVYRGYCVCLESMSRRAINTPMYGWLKKHEHL